jgi:hypothetical protein
MTMPEYFTSPWLEEKPAETLCDGPDKTDKTGFVSFVSPIVDSVGEKMMASAGTTAEGEDEPRCLDAVIAADMATKYSHAEIAARVERLAAKASRPDAQSLDVVVLADWKAILAAKGQDR